MTSPFNRTADQDSRREDTTDDEQARYSSEDMDSGPTAQAPDTADDVIVLAREDDVEEVVPAEPTDDLTEPDDDELAERQGMAGAGHTADEHTAVEEPDELVSRREPSGATRQWQDIQAMFVDDPRGSVELALQIVDGTLTSFVDGLRLRQAALAPDGSPGDTERLRATLRSCRAFCENLDEVGNQLRQPA